MFSLLATAVAVVVVLLGVVLCLGVSSGARAAGRKTINPGAAAG